MLSSFTTFNDQFDGEYPCDKTMGPVFKCKRIENSVVLVLGHIYLQKMVLFIPVFLHTLYISIAYAQWEFFVHATAQPWMFSCMFLKQPLCCALNSSLLLISKYIHF